MLVAVVDRVGRGGTRKVRSIYEDVVTDYEAHGHCVRWPVSVEIVGLGIMGATKSRDSEHTLFVSSRAVESGVLDGLIAHEMGHMLRTEARHPSHDPDVFQALSREVRIPKDAEDAFGQAFNHIQDIYADDLTFLVFSANGDDRAYRFFSGWVDWNVGSRGTDRWRNVGLAASNGFAIGNLVRHGLLSRDDDLWARVRAFDRDAGFEAVDSLADLYANLPQDPSPATFIGGVKALADLMARAATS